MNWSEEIFIVNKIKNTVPWTYAISDLNGEKITGSFNENTQIYHLPIKIY